MTVKHILSGVCMAAFIMGTVLGQGQKADAAEKKVYVTKGESVTIKVKKATRKTKWKSSKKKIIKLARGKNSLTIKGKKKGKTTISARIAGKKYKYKVVVEKPSISKEEISMEVGKTATIKIKGTKRKYKWKSNNPSVVKVNGTSGKITSLSEGLADVSAKIGKTEYSCSVTVKNVPEEEKPLAKVPSGYLSEIKEKGRVTTVQYDGTQANGTKVKKLAYVYLPYGYDEKKEYDIIYCLHGGEGDTKAYLGTNDNPGNVKKLLDHMILNKDIKPVIAVAPTYYTSSSDGSNMGTAVSKIENFTKNELVNDLIPAVEGKYSTYAKTTDLQGLKDSRKHRGYTGFSMGSLSTWRTFLNSSDYFCFFMPMSGDCWVNGVSNAGKAAEELENYCKKKGYGEEDFFIYAVTGSKDIAYSAMKAQIDKMKKISPSFHFISESSPKGNISFRVQPGATHSFAYLPLYFYNGLPKYFK